MIVLLFLICVVLLFYGVVLLYKFLWNKNLFIDIYLPYENAHEGDDVILKEVIINDKFLPVPVLEIDFNLDKGLRFANTENNSISDKLYRRDVFYLGIKKKITRSLTLNCLKRGYYTLDKLGYMSYDIFMLNKYLGSKTFHEEFYVYPRRVKSEFIAVPYNRIMGEILSRKKILDDPFEFAGIRDYTINDPMKYINWTASAKGSGLMVNVHNSSVSQKITILIDTYDNDTPTDSQLNEESIRIACSLGERFLAEGISVTFIANAHDMFTKKTLLLSDMHNLSPVELKKNLARLVLGEEVEITEYFDHIVSGSLVVMASKNKNIANKLSKFEEPPIWIMPYKIDKPSVEKGKFDIVYWEYKMHDTDALM